MKPAGSRLVALRSRLIIGAIAIVLFGCSSLPSLSAQQPVSPEQAAPPPLKIITRPERSRLEELSDPKARIKTTLELAEAHLANLEGQTAQHEYDNAAAEAGMYWALVENALAFLKKLERDNSRKRDLYKRLELALRAHGPRLSSIRRSTPAEYSIWIKEIESCAREGRTEALNSFYGDTVVRESQPKPPETREAGKPPLEN